MRAKNPDTGLTHKREAFCQAFVRLGDASAAYRECYKSSEMKPETINNRAYELLKNRDIKARIANLQTEAAAIAKEKFNIDSETILRHLDILRKARIDEYVEYFDFEVPVIQTTTTGKGKNSVTTTTTTVERRTELRFKTFDSLTEEQLMCIESIKQNRYGEIELKLHGKEWTIEKINKHIGFYAKDNEQNKPEIHVNWNEEKTYEKVDK